MITENLDSLNTKSIIGWVSRWLNYWNADAAWEKNAKKMYGIRNLREVIEAWYKTEGETGKATISRNKLWARYWNEGISSRWTNSIQQR